MSQTHMFHHEQSENNKFNYESKLKKGITSMLLLISYYILFYNTYVRKKSIFKKDKTSLKSQKV
jgi:hypothetical protein